MQKRWLLLAVVFFSFSLSQCGDTAALVGGDVPGDDEPVIDGSGIAPTGDESLCTGDDCLPEEEDPEAPVGDDPVDEPVDDDEPLAAYYEEYDTDGDGLEDSVDPEPDVANEWGFINKDAADYNFCIVDAMMEINYLKKSGVYSAADLSKNPAIETTEFVSPSPERQGMKKVDYSFGFEYDGVDHESENQLVTVGCSGSRAFEEFGGVVYYGVYIIPSYETSPYSHKYEASARNLSNAFSPTDHLEPGKKSFKFKR